MPAFDGTYSYPSSPPGFGFSSLVPQEPPPGGLTSSEMNSQWLSPGIGPNSGGYESPQSGVYTLPPIGHESGENVQEMVNPGAISDSADDRYRRSVGPPESVSSSWQPEMPFPEWSFASPAAQDETDEVPVGTLRPWSKCGWIPNEDEPEPELAEFFDQHRILTLDRPPILLEPRGIPEFRTYVDFGSRIALGHPRIQPTLAPSSVDTIWEYVASDNEQEEHPPTLPAYAPGLLARLEAQTTWDRLEAQIAGDDLHRGLSS